MLEFEESFFEGEERDGFYVEEEMKRVWAAQLEVLAEVDRICKKYGIQWYAEYGTLLGAVRHKGFIPWDDDMDISMKREDYMRFMQVAPKEIPANWHLVSPQLFKAWGQPFMRIVNGHMFDITPEHLQRFHGCPYAVGIDIFALDYLPEDEAEYEMLKTLYQNTLFTRQLIKKQEEGKKLTQQENSEQEIEQKQEEGLEQEIHLAPDVNLDEEVERCLTKLESYLRFTVDREANITNQLLCRVEQLSSIYTADECSKLGVICFMKLGDKSRVREKSWYEECVLLPFENIMIPAPKGYDAVLRGTYGDYMTPVRGTQSHDYPFYKKHKKSVQEMVEKVNMLNNRLALLEESLTE